jgi:hypothetical protein
VVEKKNDLLLNLSQISRLSAGKEIIQKCLSGDKPFAQCKTCPAKRQYIIDSKQDTIHKRRLFFLGTNFPAKRLSFFPTFLVPFKSAKFFPPKGIGF